MENTIYAVIKYRLKNIVINEYFQTSYTGPGYHLMFPMISLDVNNWAKVSHIPFGGSSHQNNQNCYTGMPGPVRW